MSKIHILPEHLSNRIAAGEVIERPASVVKELVENAIDAGAGTISIAVERAGTKLIAVSDDGSGMDQDDALLSLEPHGTSKIREETDIDAIVTLGFRGEAIPSIASISRFRLTTRTADSAEGIRVEVAGGKIIEVLPAGCAPGTTLEIRDLFFNTPARKKFLKSPPTEENHITETVIMLALPYPEISFDLAIDGRRALHSPGAATLDSRLRAFFGRHFAEQMLKVEHRESGLEIVGYTAAPGFSRTSRREQRTFVNGRAIESPAIYRGIREGYATLSENGRFPPCVLFITMPPTEVDVNVHPAKREVRFKQEYVVSRAVATAIGNALRHRETPAPTVPETIRPTLLMEGAEVRYAPVRQEQPDLPLTRIVPQEERILPRETPAIPPPAPVRPELTDRNEPAPAPEPTSEPEAATDEPEIIAPMPQRMVFSGDWPREVIGVLDRSYILASGPAGLILIDQHAAHERVLFEKLLRDSAGGVPAQHLLLPVTVELPQAAAAMLWRCRELFEKLGFDVEPMGNRTVMLNAIPASLPSGDLGTMLLDILDELIENASARLPLEKEFVARAACKAAIKSHDYLTPEAARSLLTQLANCRQGTLCPHGRPTMLTITLSEIARRFGRK
ncbi:MAG: DNA mismatch repair endonuclease MutL [Victivallaceae bacterium]